MVLQHQISTAHGAERQEVVTLSSFATVILEYSENSDMTSRLGYNFNNPSFDTIPVSWYDRRHTKDCHAGCQVEEPTYDAIVVNSLIDQNSRIRLLE